VRGEGGSHTRAAVAAAMAGTGRIGTSGGQRGSTTAVGLGDAGEAAAVGEVSTAVAAVGSHDSVVPVMWPGDGEAGGVTACGRRVPRRMASSPLLLLDYDTGMAPLW
jgi:hypothetical protein